MQNLEAESSRTAATSTRTTFVLSKDLPPAEVKLGNIEILEGQQNYEDWSSQMVIVFNAMNVLDIVVDGAKPPSDASAAEHEGYHTLSRHALLILIQVISKPILKKVSKYRSPHAIWKYLKETYYWDSDLIHQIAGLCLLFTQLEKGKSVSEFMDKFEDQWVRLYEQSAGTEVYRQKFRALLEEDFAKRDFLLAALSHVYPNSVAYLSTQSDLSYAKVRYQILGLASNNQLDDGGTALVTSNKNRKFGSEHKPSSEPTKACSYCQKHGGTSVGHVWQDCRKLKRDQKRKQHKAKNQPSNRSI